MNLIDIPVKHNIPKGEWVEKSFVAPMDCDFYATAFESYGLILGFPDKSNDLKMTVGSRHNSICFEEENQHISLKKGECIKIITKCFRLKLCLYEVFDGT